VRGLGRQGSIAMREDSIGAMRRPVLQCGLSVLAIVLAFLIHLAIEKHFGIPISPYLLFYPVIMVAAVSVGFRGGLLATLVAALVTVELHPLQPQFVFEKRSNDLGLGFFLVAAIAMNIFAELYRRARQHEASLGQELALASERRYRTLVEMSPEAVIVHHAGVVVYANEAAVNLYAAESLEKLCGTKIMTLVPPDEREIVRERFQVVDWGKRAPMRETNILRMDGKEAAVETSSGVIDWYGKAAVLSILRDITERKRAEAALIQSEKLASVGRMAASIAHEINNPLAAVMNTLYIARNIGGLPEAAMHYMDLAEEELKRISYITRQVLGFYRESGVLTRVPVSEIMDSALDLLQSRIKAKHANIEKDYRAVLEVTTTRGELRQVLSNLLVNSLECIPDHGTIKIRISAGRCAHSGELWTRVTVADDGPGIPAEIRNRVFEALFTTKDATGTGLGLWVSRQIVEKHGGSIRFRSATSGEKRGTVFSVALPAAREESEVAASAPVR